MRTSGISESHLILNLVMVSLITIFGAISGAALAQDQDAALVLYLPFDEGNGDEVEDLSMYGNDGTLQNGPEWVAGKYETALEFSGNGMNWVQVPDDDTLDITEELTIMAWVLNQGQTTYGRIVDKNNPYMLYLQDDDSLELWFTPDSPWGPTDAIVPKNTWTHAAATFDGDLIELYIDGEPEFTRDYSEPVLISENPLTIGNMTGGAVGNQVEGNNDRPFFGAIDEVKVYNRVLSGAEIKAASGPAAVQPSGKLASSWGRLKSF